MTPHLGRYCQACNPVMMCWMCTQWLASTAIRACSTMCMVMSPRAAWVRRLRHDCDHHTGLRGAAVLHAGIRIRAHAWPCMQIEDKKKKEAFALSIAFSPDGRLLACGGMKGGIGLFNVESGKLITMLEGHYKPVRSLVFTPGMPSPF